MNEPYEFAGVSLGWRPETAWLIHRRKDLLFTEVVAENLCASALPTPLAQLKQRGVTLIPHGVSLSLGGVEGYSCAALDHLSRLAELLGAPCVSEHIAYVRAGGIEAGHLLPVARTERMLDLVVSNVRRAQQVLPVPLALEHIATLFEWPEAAMDEATFVSEVLTRTGCKLVLDLANLYANAHNHGSDPLAFLRRFSREQIAYAHLAGGRWDGDVYHDTHGAPASPAVLDLLGAAIELLGPLPVLVERDHHFGTRGALDAELDEVVERVERSAVARPAPPPKRGSSRSGGPRGGDTSSDHEQQIALLGSLVLEQPAPPGFDARRLALAARALEQKRARKAQRRAL